MPRVSMNPLHASAAIIVMLLNTSSQVFGYAPAEYALDLLTEDGHFCYPNIEESTRYTVITCDHELRDPWTSWRTIPVDMNDFFQDGYKSAQPQLLRSTVGMPFPYGVFGQENVLGVDQVDGEPSPISFAVPGNNTPGIEIPFESDGTALVNLAAGVRGSLCVVKDAELPGGTVVSNAIVCDVAAADADSASKFYVRPRGWAWGYKRVLLSSALTEEQCGNAFYQDKAPVVCPNGTGESTDIVVDMSMNLMGTKYLLPMRSGAKFGIQTWIESQIAFSYWRADDNGQVYAANKPEGKEWKHWGFMLESKTGEEDAPIELGEEVWMKSTHTGKYCKVGGDNHQIVCKSSKQGLKNNPLGHTFLYNEVVPQG